MKRLIRALAVALCLPTALNAQDDALLDPSVVMEESFARWKAEDLSAYREYMSAAIRRARQEDVLAPDWAFIFGTYSDFVRNEDQNSPLALRLAEEGLAYLAPHAAENPDLSALLQVSRIYALADLGRYEEATTAARLAEPTFRATLGAELADNLVNDIAAWEKRQPTIFNNAPTDLARDVLKKSEEALSRGEYGTGLTLAARAVLPEGSGLDPDEVRRINAAAAARTGRALYWLNRRAEAADVMQRAANMVAEPGWLQKQSPVLSLDPGPEKQAMAELFFWLARAAIESDDLVTVLPALHLAETLDNGDLGLLSIHYARSAFYDLVGEPDRSVDELEAAVRRAEAAGANDQALLSRYYLAVRHLMSTGEEPEMAALIDLTRQMVEQSTPGGFYDPLHIQSETAKSLLETPHQAEALDFARAALKGRLAELSHSSDSQLGRDGQRAHVRGLVEALLKSAHEVDSDGPDADCSTTEVEGMGCVVTYAR